MELGLYTFAELTTDPQTGHTITAEERLRRLLEEVELAERVGLEVFGIGEHHRSDYAVSTPAVALAAAAARTEKIRLTSAVTVLSSEDPVRVFQDFATIDLLSHGRAEIMVGRGSFTESFPLFGQDLKDYDELFAEKLELLLQVRASLRVTWSGRHRPPLRDQPVYPRPVQDPLPVWVAVGGNPESAVRAGVLGLPMAIAIIGGMPERFAGLAQLHQEAARRTWARSAAGAQHQLARLHRRHRGGGGRRRVSRVQRADEQDRPRARLGPDVTPRLRRVGDPARRELRRRPG